MESTAQYRGTQCPPRGLLLAFDIGDLPPAEIDTISIHLATCEVCLAFLDSRNQGLPGKSIDGKIPVLFSDEESAKSSLLDDTAFEKIRGDSGFQQMKAFAKAIRIDEDRETAGMGPPAPFLPKPDDEVDPVYIGSYFVARKLGKGAFADVYLTNDPKTDEPLAIKVPRKLKGEEQIKEFLAEAKKAAGLNHPGIVRVYGFDRLPNGGCYVVMKYIKGRSLETAMQSERFSFEKIAEICIQIAGALEYIHQEGYVHRDIKPANILLDQNERPYVADFGLAIHEDVQHEYRDQRAGTWPYMSPEQVDGKSDHLDGRSDVWSLGVILYELLTRKRPFPSKDKSILADQIKNRDPKPPRSLERTVPEEIERICMSCLSKELSSRCGSAADLASELRGWLASLTRRRMMRVGVFAAAVCLALMCGTAVGIRYSTPKPEPPPSKITNSLGMTFPRIPASEFLMGSPESDKDREADEQPIHLVKITKPLYVSEYEVTIAQYCKVMGDKRTVAPEEANKPITDVTCEDAELFCKRLSQFGEEHGKHRHYRLLSEAEWEYCCRAGTSTRFSFGDALTQSQALFGPSLKLANNDFKRINGPNDVGTFPPNAFGLYDMHGNVWEWCADEYEEPYSDKTANDPLVIPGHGLRITRGGAWSFQANHCRSANRQPIGVSQHDKFTGFRVCLEIVNK